MLSSWAWLGLLAVGSKAQELIDNMSFGHKEGSLVAGKAIANWHILGDKDKGTNPDIFSDRVIITPPYPGNTKGGLWTKSVIKPDEWEAEAYFRVNGPERGFGTHQFWYARNGKDNVGTASLYSVGKFDGLVLVLDQYEGRGGSLRGFLNDDTTSFKDQAALDTLAFGQCNFPYRNTGRFIQLKIKHAFDGLEVTVDGQNCFKSDKIRIPSHYMFGVTSTTSDTPDSFEIHRFIVTSLPSSVNAPRVQNNQQSMQSGGRQSPPNTGDIPSELPDVLAATIKSQEMQFEDLHNRMQILDHHVQNIFKELEVLTSKEEERWTQLMNRIVPVHDKTIETERIQQRIEKIVNALQRDIEGKDYRETLTSLQNAVRDTHSNIMSQLPQSMNDIVTSSRPKMSTFIALIFIVQIVLMGGYIAYKRRREGMPKKYL